MAFESDEWRSHFSYEEIRRSKIVCDVVWGSFCLFVLWRIFQQPNVNNEELFLYYGFNLTMFAVLFFLYIGLIVGGWLGTGAQSIYLDRFTKSGKQARTLHLSDEE